MFVLKFLVVSLLVVYSTVGGEEVAVAAAVVVVQEGSVGCDGTGFCEAKDPELFFDDCLKMMRGNKKGIACL